MDETEIIEKMDQFLDKQGLDIQGKYFITKKMNEEYWEDVLGEGEQNEDDPLGDLGEDIEPEEELLEEPEEEIAAPKPEKKKKLTVKKPKVTAKILEKVEEPPKETSEEEEKDAI